LDGTLICADFDGTRICADFDGTRICADFNGTRICADLRRDADLRESQRDADSRGSTEMGRVARRPAAWRSQAGETGDRQESERHWHLEAF
jgi:ligand-binding sensor protein